MADDLDLPHQDTDMTEAVLDHDVHVADGGLEVNSDGHRVNGSGGPVVPSSEADEGRQEPTQDTMLMDRPSDRHDEDMAEALSSSELEVVESQNEQITCMPLSVPSDTSTLSPLHCFIRQYCVEYFTATNVHTSPDGGSPQRGRTCPITEGRVGIRCVFCKNSDEKAAQSTSFPGSIDQIPTSVSMWLARHKDSCRSIPSGVKQKLTELGQRHNGKEQGNSKATWIESAKEKGLIDAAEGIMFADSVNTKHENTWECCGETYSNERKRCTFCKKWNRGKRRADKPENESISLPPGIELTTPKKHHCKVRDCKKREQSGNEGFCRRHYNLIVLKMDSQASTPQASKTDEKSAKRGGFKGEVIEVEDDEQASLRGIQSRCSVPGCDKYTHKNCEGVCFKHHRHSLKKYDNVERAGRKSISPRKVMSPSGRRNNSTNCGPPVSIDQNVSRSGRSLTPTRRYGDDDGDDGSKSSIEVISPTTKRTKCSKVEQLEEISPSKKRKANHSLFCKFEGCTKYKQSGRDGYCCAHSSAMKLLKLQQYKDEFSDHKNGVNGSTVDNKNQVIVPSTKSEGQLNERVTNLTAGEIKPIETNSSLPSKSPAKKSVKGSESKAPPFAKQRKSLKGNENIIKEGDMVKVDDGMLARVLKVNSSNDSKIVTYNIMKILGGREEMVDGTRLSVYRSGSLIQCHPVTDSSKRHVQPFKNTHAMLEMTRYNLLSGQDCWICTSCSVIVPSLTMPCGVCNMYISFVPLEMKEFEGFVRGQRKKENHCWLRKNDINKDDECGISMSHLCKFQGCVQPSQISYDGYCEFHFNSVGIVKEKDRALTNDYIYHLYEQMEPIVLTEDDLLNLKNKGKEIGEVGLACKHCKGRRSFPNGVEAIRQKTYTTSLYNHVKECEQCPFETKDRLALLKERVKREKDEGLGFKPKAGSSTRQFLLRIWKRLERLSSLEEDAICRLQGCQNKPNCDGLCEVHRTAARLIRPNDRNVISHFASLAFEQMQPCYLIDSDKRDESCSTYVNGAPGLECRHCIGQPDHMRCFPANEASINDTCSAEQISAHLRVCVGCPEKIKAKLAALALGNNEDEEGLKTFYRRVWTRIQPQLKKSEPKAKIEKKDDTPVMHNAPDQRLHES